MEENTCCMLFSFVYLLISPQKIGDELFPQKDGQPLTSDVDYVDVWRVRAHVLSLFACPLCVCVSTVVDIYININPFNMLHHVVVFLQ